MSSLTIAAVMALAATCQTTVAPVTIAKIAQHESGLNPFAKNVNRDGSADYGLMQINERNFSWLGLTRETAMDPCRSIAAGAAVLTAFSRYNTGSATNGITNGYAVKVQGVRLDTTPTPTQEAPIQTALNPHEADLEDMPDGHDDETIHSGDE